tara:strand:- start:466 stop:708 length:243 start_codon:yes stop_codon:yes gene_type:complete
MNKLTLGLALFSAFMVGIVLADTKQSFISPAYAQSSVEVGRYSRIRSNSDAVGIFDSATGAQFICTRGKTCEISSPAVGR